jgi:hypothetical protein
MLKENRIGYPAGEVKRNRGGFLTHPARMGESPTSRKGREKWQEKQVPHRAFSPIRNDIL